MIRRILEKHWRRKRFLERVYEYSRTGVPRRRSGVRDWIESFLLPAGAKNREGACARSGSCAGADLIYNLLRWDTENSRREEGWRDRETLDFDEQSQKAPVHVRHRMETKSVNRRKSKGTWS